MPSNCRSYEETVEKAKGLEASNLVRRAIRVDDRYPTHHPINNRDNAIRRMFGGYPQRGRQLYRASSQTFGKQTQYHHPMRPPYSDMRQKSYPREEDKHSQSHDRNRNFKRQREVEHRPKMISCRRCGERHPEGRNNCPTRRHKCNVCGMIGHSEQEWRNDRRRDSNRDDRDHSEYSTTYSKN